MLAEIYNLFRKIKFCKIIFKVYFIRFADNNKVTVQYSAELNLVVES